MKLKPDTFSYTVFLSMSVALGALSTDMYLPSLPAMQEAFSASVDEVQWTLSAFMIGIAAFQLVVGPISDRFGRKKTLFVGLAVFILASYGCMYANNVVEMTFYRIIQSFGVCTGVVVPRAMVRDLFELKDSAKQLSRIGTIMAVAPAIAPVFGGYIATYYGWQGIFFFLGTYGALVAIILLVSIDESLDDHHKSSLRLRNIISNYADLLKSREYLGYVLTASFCFAGFFTYISSSSFVLITVYELPVDRFGYYFGSVVIGFMTGTLIGPKVTQLSTLRFSLQVGVFVSLFGGSLLLVLFLNGYGSPVMLVVPMIFYNIGVGMVMPQCQAGAMHPFPEKAGAASALSGFIILGVAGLMGALAGNLFNGTEIPMVIIVFVMAIVTFVFFHMTIFRNPGSIR
ncbi:Bcr/CflA family efflux MFS transporter [Sneathiella sp. P13V-1]|uniref:multidrug effflux MFS transporter n=1 Tax=Sneathiella sp. P13V-1 TaxID=2697366 RepID=UPI00187B6F96|nr:multidrug effflux MFS transporter [Sneathiella sp. P13V-1]MBE7636042.1 Bcr/CflA family efflux MFS transporter [Sneathiella sp. P13V-1]